MKRKSNICMGCDRLQAKIDNLKVKLEKSEMEWWERGKEIEQINAVISARRDILDPDCYELLRTILDKYIKRCTTTGGTGAGKYQRNARKRRTK